MLKYKRQKVLKAQTYKTTLCRVRLAIKLSDDPREGGTIWTGKVEGEPVAQIGHASDFRELAQVLNEVADFMEGIKKVSEPELKAEPEPQEALPASQRFETSALKARVYWWNTTSYLEPRVTVNFGGRHVFNPQVINAKDAEDLSKFFAALAKDLHDRF